jgi:hypothetical protein
MAPPCTTSIHPARRPGEEPPPNHGPMPTASPSPAATTSSSPAAPSREPRRSKARFLPTSPVPPSAPRAHSLWWPDSNAPQAGPARARAGRGWTRETWVRVGARAPLAASIPKTHRGASPPPDDVVSREGIEPKRPTAGVTLPVHSDADQMFSPLSPALFWAWLGKDGAGSRTILGHRLNCRTNGHGRRSTPSTASSNHSTSCFASITPSILPQ